MGNLDLFRKGPSMRVGREIPHLGGGEEPHGGRENHTEVVGKATNQQLLVVNILLI